MEVVDLGHVAEQNVLLVVEGDGDEVRHAGVIHLISITLEHTQMCIMVQNYKTITNTGAWN